MSTALQYGLIIITYAILVFVIMDSMKNQKVKNLSVKKLNAEEFQKLLIRGQIIDVRSKDEFVAGHILGARNFDLKTLKRSTQGLRKDQVQFVYGANYKQAKKGANSLYKAGFPKIVVMKDKLENFKGKMK